MDATTLTISRVSPEVAALAMSARLWSRDTDTTGGLETVDHVVTGCECFEVQLAGVPVLHYALQVQQRPNGVEVVIAAAAGDAPGVNLVESVMPAIEKQASGADMLTVHTRRKGLVAKLAAQGFELAGFIMRKRLCSPYAG